MAKDTAWIMPVLWCRTNCQDAGDQFGELQCLNISLQRTSQTNSGMQAVCWVPHWGKKGKTNDAFQSLFEKASTIVVDHSATNQATTQVSDWCFSHSLQSISAKWSTDTVETGKNPAYWKNDSVVDKYPEIVLPVFRLYYPISHRTEPVEIQVLQQSLRLLFIITFTSSESGRYFTALSKWMTWLHSEIYSTLS